jgi:hypothetical protein
MRSLVVLVVGSQLFGCLDSQKPAAQQEAKPTPVSRAPEPAPKPAPVPETSAKVDLALAEGLEMRRPIHDGRLTLIPIIATRAIPTQKFVTLHDGMRRGMVSVREMGGSDSWEVDTVRVTNRSSETLVILEGELIEDAMQDRVTAEAVTILAGKTQTIQVRCVEEDRDYGTTKFNPGNAIAEVSLRRTVVHQTQDAVWSKVKQINSRDKIRTKTNTYRLAAKAQLDGDNGVRKDRLMKQLELMEERSNMVGLAVAIDGKVVAIDRLATPDLYRSLEGKLLASYLPDTAGESPVEGRRIAPEDVRKLAQAEAGTQTIASHSVMKPL